MVTDKPRRSSAHPRTRRASAGPPSHVPLAFLLLACGAGCGSDDGFGQRHAVSGTVTLNGNPLESGTIVFVPLGVGPSAQAAIERGAYSLARSEGVGSGTYRVEISSIQRTGKRVFDPGEREMIEESVNIIPSEYNVNSTLRLEAKAGSAMTFDAKLESKPTAAAKSKGR